MERFAKRGDLRRHAGELADSGVAGAPIYYSFFWPTARWLARKWPDKLSIDWPAFKKKEGLIDFLHLLLPYSETPALDMLDHTVRKWMQELKGPGESDAAFLIRRFDALRADPQIRETLFESFDVPIKLTAGTDTPARTRARYAPSPVVYQSGPLSRKRPKLRREILARLAELHRETENYEAAQPLFERALAIREAALGPDHLDTAWSLIGLGGLHIARKQYDEAEAAYRRAAAIYTNPISITPSSL